MKHVPFPALYKWCPSENTSLSLTNSFLFLSHLSKDHSTRKTEAMIVPLLRRAEWQEMGCWDLLSNLVNKGIYYILWTSKFLLVRWHPCAAYRCWVWYHPIHWLKFKHSNHENIESSFLLWRKDWKILVTAFTAFPLACWASIPPTLYLWFTESDQTKLSCWPQGLIFSVVQLKKSHSFCFLKG